MDEEAASICEEAYAALEEALGAAGSERALLVERALDLWRIAHDANCPLTPPTPSNGDGADQSARSGELAGLARRTGEREEPHRGQDSGGKLEREWRSFPRLGLAFKAFFHAG